MGTVQRQTTSTLAVGARAILAASAALLLAACSGTGDPGTAAIGPPAEPGAPSKPVKIAMLLPLGGFDQTAIIAKSMKQAAEMALFELDNPAVQLIVKDDKGSAEGARVATEDAIKEGAEIILGPLLAKAVAGAAAPARQANVPVVAFSNDRQVAGNGVYLMSFLAEPEVERIVSFAVSQGKRRFAALIPDDAYGRAIEPVFRMSVARHGGEIADLQLYPVKTNGMLEPAQHVFTIIKDSQDTMAPIDALFLPGGQEILPRLGPLIAYAGIDTNRIKLLGTGAWEYPNIGREAAFVGGWYASPDPSGWQQFSQRFAKTFGSAPPRVASLAYDALTMAVTLSSSPANARYTVANLTRPTGFSGTDGPVRFLTNGLSERGLAVLEVQKFGSTLVDGAPRALANTDLSPLARAN